MIASLVNLLGYEPPVIPEEDERASKRRKQLEALKDWVWNVR
jgi:hypothetical protein